MADKKGLFDHLNNVTQWKKPFDVNDPNDTGDYNQFMINRFVSMLPTTIHIAETLNRYPDIPDKAHHDFLCNVLPNRKTYFKYMKGKKEANIEDLQTLMKYYKIGMKDAKDYFAILSKEQLNVIKKKYQTGVMKQRRKRK